MSRLDPPSRLAGLLAPLFCLCREGDDGIGDTTALEEWIDWAGRTGTGFIQMLPINETGPDNSPYNAISSVALDPIYLDVTEATTDIRDSSPAGRVAARLVDYADVRRRKEARLRRSFERFRSAASAVSRDSLRQFREDEKAWLDDYVIFRWLMDLAGGSPEWDRWPAEFSSPAAARSFVEARRRADSGAVEPALEYFAYVQWVASRQWRRVREHAAHRGVRLMGDMPIGVSYYSADVFFHPELFQLDWSAGSPPEPAYREDPFVRRWGQNWGVPLHDWAAHERTGFDWWRRRVRKTSEIFDLFRIDHVLGFYRQYAFPWRPERNDEFLELSIAEAEARTGGRIPRFHERDDSSAENAAFNRAHGDRALRVVCAAAEPAGVVAEDLGWVPDYVRPHLLELGIPGFRIPHWEDDPNYPECSFAAYATHDLPTLRSLIEALRTAMKSPGGAGRAEAETDWRRLARFAGFSPGEAAPPFTSPVKWQLIDALLACPSRFAAVPITDLFDVELRFNTPGTAGSHNWTGRLPWTACDLELIPGPAAEARRWRNAIVQARRTIYDV